jgi:hypothetical protein
MDFGIAEKVEQIQQLFSGQSASMIIVACIPAGFSFVAWFAPFTELIPREGAKTRGTLARRQFS